MKLIDHFILSSIFVIKLKKMFSTTDDTFDDELHWVRKVSKKSEFFPNYILDNLELGKRGKFLKRNSIF